MVIFDVDLVVRVSLLSEDNKFCDIRGLLLSSERVTVEEAMVVTINNLQA